MQKIQVIRSTHKTPAAQLGPLPAYRDGNVVAYEFELPESYEPWQRFLGRHLQQRGRPVSQWADFPPACIARLRALPAPLGTPVRAPR